MYNNVLLAAALQQWERYSVHALAARDIVAILARQAKQLHVLCVYEHEPARIPTSGLPSDMTAQLREQQIEQTDRLMAEKMDEYVAPLVSQAARLEDPSPRQSSERHRRDRIRSWGIPAGDRKPQQARVARFRAGRYGATREYARLLPRFDGGAEEVTGRRRVASGADLHGVDGWVRSVEMRNSAVRTVEREAARVGQRVRITDYLQVVSQNGPERPSIQRW